ncbi:hypothetical protein FJTKL_04914 [Diaporthe vaccinii]|uniref:Uncharacterized protein n=1 Tax=Diaporthe vaccinii TaxID=105482 RepID=A0ABR4DV99_9PEZI
MPNIQTVLPDVGDKKRTRNRKLPEEIQNGAMSPKVKSKAPGKTCFEVPLDHRAQLRRPRSEARRHFVGSSASTNPAPTPC